MLRRDQQIRSQLQQLLDACLLALALALAYLIRSNEAFSAWLNLGPPSPYPHYVWLFLIVVPAGPMLLEMMGFYEPLPGSPRHKVLWALFRGCALTTVAVILAIFFFKLTVSRPVIVLFALLSFLFIYLRTEVLRQLYSNRLARAQIRRRVLLAGTAEEIARFRQALRVQPYLSLDVVAELRLDEADATELIRLLHDHAVNGVLISAKRTCFDKVEAAIQACETEGVECWLSADFFPTHISRPGIDELLGRPVIVFRATPETSWQTAAKQIVDFVGALALLALLAPFCLVVALVIRLTSPGPVFFRQLRAGLNGQPFMMYKFRTMVTDAEQRKDELAAFNEMSGPVFKMEDDPRIIPVGRFLRRYSIDEWPQLWNVLRGQMSLVGPRPLPVEEVRRFDALADRRRLSVKPGLTCLWQISGRSHVTDFKDWVRLDLEYIDHWTIWLDLKILLRTIPVVLLGAGAK